ncbi:MAG: hypothetical protein AABX78_03110 [Nanoarchaeota archaeon]
MEDKILHLFKLEYSWYEGEFQSTILATTREKEEIEQDIREIANSIRIDRKKEDAFDCKPEAYRRIVNALVQKGYVVCYFLSDPEYYVDEVGYIKNARLHKYGIIHLTKKIEWKRLKNARKSLKTQN